MTLIVDLLIEARRRHMLANNASLQGLYKTIHIIIKCLLYLYMYVSLLDPASSTLRKEQLGKYRSQMSDDEPLYDSVASDDDYALTSTDNAIPEYSTQFKMNNEVRNKLRYSKI